MDGRTQIVICDKCNFCWRHTIDERIERQRILERCDLLRRIHPMIDKESKYETPIPPPRSVKR